MPDCLLVNGGPTTREPARTRLCVVETAANTIWRGRISLACAEADIPAATEDGERMDCEDRWVAPSPIDCHTHPVHASRGVRS
jgi:imidazolonepropionase-like amidohydrolase